MPPACAYQCWNDNRNEADGRKCGPAKIGHLACPILIGLEEIADPSVPQHINAQPNTNERTKSIGYEESQNMRGAYCAYLLPKRERMACVREEGLHPALHPASPLRQPILERRWRFFMCGGGQHAARPSAAHETQTEVCVFRHIPRVPAADLPQNTRSKMI